MTHHGNNVKTSKPQIGSLVKLNYPPDNAGKIGIIVGKYQLITETMWQVCLFHKSKIDKVLASFYYDTDMEVISQ